MIAKDANGAPNLTDTGPSFTISTGDNRRHDVGNGIVYCGYARVILGFLRKLADVGQCQDTFFPFFW